MNEKVEELILLWSEKLGVAANQLWEIMLVQAKFEGYKGLGVGLILVLIVCALFLFAKRAHSYAIKEKYPEMDFIAFCIVLISILPFYGIVCNVFNGISYIVNPGYWVIQQLMP